MVSGMEASPSLVAGLHVPELGRDFAVNDLLYLNDYGVRPEDPPVDNRRGSKECTQFSFWGESSTNAGIIAGRNMDGENDFRKITVSHFLALAVTPSEGYVFCKPPSV